MSHRFVSEMASYTTLVHVHVETALKVASFVARLVADGQAFEDKCKAAVAAQDTAGFLQTIMEQEGAIYGMENDKGEFLVCCIVYCTRVNCIRCLCVIALQISRPCSKHCFQ